MGLKSWVATKWLASLAGVAAATSANGPSLLHGGGHGHELLSLEDGRRVEAGELPLLNDRVVLSAGLPHLLSDRVLPCQLLLGRLALEDVHFCEIFRTSRVSFVVAVARGKRDEGRGRGQRDAERGRGVTMNDALFSAIKDIERVAKKQRTCSEKTKKYIAQMVRHEMEAEASSPRAVRLGPAWRQGRGLTDACASL